MACCARLTRRLTTFRLLRRHPDRKDAAPGKKKMGQGGGTPLAAPLGLASPPASVARGRHFPPCARPACAKQQGVERKCQPLSADFGEPRQEPICPPRLC